MKCLCGNKYLGDYEINRELDFCGTKEQKQKLEDENGEKFVKINGSFFIEASYSFNTEICLYACPKCGTIITSRFNK
jgi:hypothetical protein